MANSACFSTCETDQCLSDSEYGCTVCKQGLFVQPDSRCTCFPGFYFDGTSCLQCPTANFCKECDPAGAHPCTKCGPNASVDGSGVCQCDINYLRNSFGDCKPQVYFPACSDPHSFLNVNNTCQACAPQCQTCAGDGPNLCLTCPDQSVLQTYKDVKYGICICKMGLFMNMNHTCQQCHPTCHSCDGPTDTNCQECAEGLKMVLGKCVCPPGNYLKDNKCFAQPVAGAPCKESEWSNSGVCTPCTWPCSSCTSATACTACIAPRVPGSTPNTCVCPQGTFESAAKDCVPCHETCDTCTGPDANLCTTCPPLREASSGSCVCKTSVGALLNTNNNGCLVQKATCGAHSFTNEFNQCEMCDANCADCLGPLSNNCITCAPGAMMVLEKSPLVGKCVCMKGSFPDGKQCSKCHPTCFACNGPTESGCSECGPNASLVATTFGKKCVCTTGFSRNAQNFCAPSGPTGCPPSTYLSGTQCAACTPGCLACSATACTSCISPAVIDQGKCRCPKGLTMKNGVCSQCGPNCLECDGDVCYTCDSFSDSVSGKCECKPGNKRDVTGSCTPEGDNICKVGFFFDAGDCVACHSSCLTCTAAANDNCVKCPSNRTFDTNTCVCNPGSYASGSDCLPCIGGCVTCTGPAAADCTTYGSDTTSGTCNDPKSMWIQEKAVCEPIKHDRRCSYKQYFDATANTCVPCGLSCRSCVGKDNVSCLSCNTGAVFTSMSTFLTYQVGKCACPDMTRTDQDGSCAACPSNCKVCNAAGCSQCVDNASFNTSGACVCKPDHTYESTVKKCIPDGSASQCNYDPFKYWTSTVCAACHADCLTCSGPADTQCTKCNAQLGKELSGGAGTACTCIAGFFASGATCTKCPSTCSVCTSATDCTTCFDDSNMTNNSDGTCTCTDTAEELNPVTNTCIPAGTCSDGYYRTATAGCQPCNFNCATCTAGTGDSCLTCKATMVLAGSTCLCPEGFYGLAAGGCDTCKIGCAKCSSVDSCDQCKQGFLKSVVNNLTVCNCPPYTKLDPSGACVPVIIDSRCVLAEFWNTAISTPACEACVAPCNSCSFKNNNCLTCAAGFAPEYTTDGRVLCKCPKGSFQSGTTCTACSPGCSDCRDAATCDKCFPTALYANLACSCPASSTWSTTTNSCEIAVGACGEGRYSVTTGTVNSCEKCADPCAGCSGPAATQCTLCNPKRGLELATGQCVCMKRSYQVTDTVTGVVSCKPCDQTCATCSGPAANQCITCVANRALASGVCKCAANTFQAKDACLTKTPDATCAAGKYLDPATGAPTGVFATLTDGCRPCAPSCETCIGGQPDLCLTCKSGTTAMATGYSFAVSCNCPDGKFWDGSACADCQPNCKRCESADKCNECKIGSHIETSQVGPVCACDIGSFEPDSTGICQPKPTSPVCTNAQYMKKDNTCGACDTSCQTCFEASIKSCKSCKPNANLFIRGLDQECRCNPGYWMNAGNCSPCIKNCIDCADGTTCNKCNALSTLSGNSQACNCAANSTANSLGDCIPNGTSSECPFNTFNDNGTCKPCVKPCLTCTGPAATQCAGCNDDRELITGKCVCKAGSFETTDGACKPCSLYCKKCTDEKTCTECSPNAILSPEGCNCITGFVWRKNTKTCVAVPATVGTFLDSANTSQQCHVSCQFCSGPADVDCAVCKANAALKVVPQENSLGNGLCACKVGTFQDFSGGCQVCHAACNGCFGASDVECLTCAVGFNKSADGRCVCPANTAFDMNQKACLPSTAGSNCSPGLYSDTTGACKACNSSCQSCVGAEDDKCLSCPVGASLMKDPTSTLTYGKCACNPGFYINFTGTQAACVVCDSTCLTCKGGTGSDCLSCKTDRKLSPLSTGGNVCACLDGYQDNFTTMTCEPKPTSTACPFDKYSSSTGCLPCHESCLTCITGSSDGCGTCKPASMKVLKKIGTTNFGTCGCPEKSFLRADGVCSPCHTSCVSCSGPESNQCLTCSPSATISTAKQCICKAGMLFDPLSQQCYNPATCTAATYTDSTGACTIPCHPSCARCAGNTEQHCLACKVNAVAVASTYAGYSKCVCASGYFMDTTMNCVACSSTCKSCTGPNANQCLDCLFDRKIEKTAAGSQCICMDGYLSTSAGCIPKATSPDCPADKFKDPADNLCKGCMPSCKTCLGPAAADCVVCPPNAFLPKVSDNTFVPKGPCTCAPGSWWDNTNAVCASCPSTCAECSDSTTCTKCFADREISGANCVCKGNWVVTGGVCGPPAAPAGCRLNQYLDSSVCKDCHGSCKTCAGNMAYQCTSCEFLSNMVLAIQATGTAGQGVCTCDKKFFLDPNNISKCLPCDPTCLTCNGPSSSSCTSCLANGVILATPTGKICQCAANFTWNMSKGICEATATCTGATFLSSANFCSPCDKSCATCKGPSDNECLTCASPRTVSGTKCVCAAGKFFDGTNCADCHITCGECTGPTLYDCTTCKANMQFTSQVFTDFTLKKCDCVPNYVWDQSTNACIPKVTTDCTPTNKFRAGDGTCVDCHYLCSTCFGPGADQCYTCAAGAVPPVFTQMGTTNSNPSGKCSCPKNAFDNTTTGCTACDASCVTCHGATANDCDSCGQFKDLNAGACACRAGYTASGAVCVPPVSDCPFGMFLGATTCMACHPTCESCNGGMVNNCLSCRSELGYKLIKTTIDTTGVCKCPDGAYSTDQGCKPCAKSCQSCTGPADSQCLNCLVNSQLAASTAPSFCVCKATFLPDSKANCVAQCADKTKFGVGCTTACIGRCEECIDIDTCTKCKVGFTQTASSTPGLAKCECPAGKFYDQPSANCVSCHNTCGKCTGPTDQHCQECKTHATFTMTPIGGKCDCEIGFKSVNGDCKADGTSQFCSPNQFFDLTTNACAACNQSCLTCTGPEATKCQLCKDNASIINGLCQCKLGFVLNATGDCVPCGNDCLDCSTASICKMCAPTSTLSSTNTCNCKDGYTRQTTTGNCVPASTSSCPAKNYIIGTSCFPCSPACLNCVKDDASSCVSCDAVQNKKLVILDTVAKTGKCVCQDGFYQVNESCMPCSPKCRTCKGPSACESCKDNSVLTVLSTGSDCDCKGGFIWNDKLASCVSLTNCPAGQFTNSAAVCATCEQTCATCIGGENDKCVTCKTPLVPIATINLAGVQLVKCTCAVGSYNTSPTACAACHATCKTCKGPNAFDCTACPQNSMIKTDSFGGSTCECSPNYSRNTAGECVPQNMSTLCPMSQFEDKSTSPSTCVNCHETCNSCMGNAPDLCLTCPVSANLIPAISGVNVNFGKCQCADGFAFAVVSGKTVCSPCHASCTTCKGTATTDCLNCKGFLEFTTTGTCECPWTPVNGVCVQPKDNALCDANKFYLNNQCMPCHASCASCKGSSEYECLSCNKLSNRVLINLQAGVTIGQCECRDGFFPNFDRCDACHPSCRECSGPAANQCTACYVSATLASGACTCDSGFNFNPETRTCVNCAANEFSAGGTCTACHSTCASCIGPSQTDCTVCAGGFVQVPSTTSNVRVVCQCNPGNFYNGSACAACAGTCKECAGTADNCVACVFGQSLVSVSGKGQCACPAGYVGTPPTCTLISPFGCAQPNQYKDTAGTCQACFADCGTCTGPSQYECLKCPLGATLSPTGSCVCSKGTFKDADKTCKACHMDCQECSAATSTTCTLCASGKALVSNACVKCDVTCKECSDVGADKCTVCEPTAALQADFSCACLPGYARDEHSSCVPQAGPCGLGYFKNSVGLCTICEKSCLSCIGPSASDCTACTVVTNRILTSTFAAGVGTCDCRPGTFLNNGVCTPCHSKCDTCNGPNDNQCLTCSADKDPVILTVGKSCTCKPNTVTNPFTGVCYTALAANYIDATGRQVPCPATCTNCVGPNADHCLTCPAGRTLALVNKETGSCKCNPGTFQSSKGICEACPLLCDVCTEFGCTQCKVNARFDTTVATKQCICSTNYKENAGNCEPANPFGCGSVTQFKDNAGTCTACDASCGSCTGPSQTDCMTCISTQLIFSQVATTPQLVGSCKCPIGKFLAAPNCSPCIAGCEVCVDGTTCARCAPGFVATGTTCGCAAGFTLTAGKCEPDTSLGCGGVVGTFDADLVTAGDQCQPCHFSCAGCVGFGFDQCTTCRDPANVLVKAISTNTFGTCKCAPGSFFSVDKCAPCDRNCAECGTSAMACTVCPAGFSLSAGKCVCTVGVYDPVNFRCVNNAACTAGQFNDPANTCQACDNSCATCLGAAKNQCLTCKAGMSPASSAAPFGCICSSSTTFFNPSTGTCDPCDATCSTCTNSATNCLSCNSSANRALSPVGLTGTCPCKPGYTDTAGTCNLTLSGSCAAGTWSNAGTCTPCPAGCATCTSASVCLICKANATLDGSTLCPCNAGFFLDSSNNCTKCDLSCSTCSALTTCVTCRPNAVLGTGTCRCAAGFTFNTATGNCDPPVTTGPCTFDSFMSSTGSCVKCDLTCLTCNELGPNRCLTCRENAVLKNTNGVTECVCKSGFYYDIINRLCKACDATCLECSGPAATECSSCRAPGYALTAGSCGCAAGYGGATCTPQGTAAGCATNQWDNSGTCTNCDVSCATCADATSCAVCKSGYVQATTGTLCTCPGFISSGTCSPCHVTCKTCTGASSTQCASCPVGSALTSGSCGCSTGYYRDPTDNLCKPTPNCGDGTFFSAAMKCEACHPLCATCSGSTSSNCLSCSTNAGLSGTSTCLCNTGYYFDAALKACTAIPTCAAGTFVDSTFKCAKCHPSCRECNGPNPGDCTVCITDATKTSPTAVVSSCACKPGTLFNGIACSACNINCATCGTNVDVCLTCPAGFILQNSRCVCDVNNKQYLDSTSKCLACHPRCKSCNGPNNNQCLTCDPGSVLTKATATAVTGVCGCDFGYYFDETQAKCVVKPTFSGCNTSSYLFTTTSGAQTCGPCHKTCLECTSDLSTACTSCPFDRNFVSGTFPSTYTGAITGSCVCKTAAPPSPDTITNTATTSTSQTSPTSGGTTSTTEVIQQCALPACPQGQYLEYTFAQNATDTKPMCKNCDPTCLTCIGGLNSACTTCNSNSTLDSSSGIGFCKCKPEYADSTGKCQESQVFEQTNNCPFPRSMCTSLTGICSFATTGLVNPSAECLKQIYPFCCFDANKDRCNSLNYKFDQCTVVDTPKVTSATFSPDASYIKIKFSLPITVSSTICNQVIDDTLQQLGLNPRCNLNPQDTSVYEIYLDPYSKFKVGDTIKFKAGSIKSSAALATTSNQASSVVITGPPAAQAKAINVIVTYPITVSSCEPKIILDGSASNGGGALTFLWTTTAGSFENANLSTVNLSGFQTVNTVTVSVTVTDTLGSKVTKAYTITIVSGAVPYVELPFDNLEIVTSQRLLVEATASKSSCSTLTTTTFTYVWSLLSSTDTAMTPATFSTLNSGVGNQLLIAPGKLSSGKTYAIQAQVTDSNGGVGKANLTITTKAPKLKAFVSGGDRLIGSTEAVFLSASLTDPNTGSAPPTSNATYVWSCEDWTAFGGTNPLYSSGVQADYVSTETKSKYSSFTPVKCMTSGGQDLEAVINKTSQAITIPSGSVPKNSLFYMKVEAKGNSLTGTAYTWLKTSSNNQTTISVAIDSSLQYLNSTGVNSLRAVVNSSNPYVISWSMTTAGETVVWKSPTDKKQVGVEGRSLKQNVIYIFNCTVTSGNEVAYSTLSLSLNSPPTGGTFEISPYEGDYDTNFTVSFNNWVDPEGLTCIYKIYVYDSDDSRPAALKIWGTNNIFRNLKLPPSFNREQLKIKGSVEDSLGNLVDTNNQTVKITKIDSTQAGTQMDTMYNEYSTDRSSKSNKEKLDSVYNMVKFGAEATDSSSVETVMSQVKDEILNLCSASQATTEAEFEQCFSSISECSKSSGVDPTTMVSTAEALLSQYDTLDKAIPSSVLDTLSTFAKNIIDQALNPSSRLGRKLQTTSSSSTVTSSVESLNDKSCKYSLKGVSTGVDVTSSTSSTSLKCSSSDLTDLQTSGSSFSVNNPNSTNVNTVAVPADHFANQTSNVCINSWVNEGQLHNDTTTDNSDTAQASSEFTMNFKDCSTDSSIDLRGSSTYINFTMTFSPPSDFVKPDFDVYNSSTKDNFTDFELNIQCRYWDESTQSWSTEGINNTMTEVDFTTNQVKCYTQHASTYSVGYTNTTRITPETPDVVEVEDDDSDTWHTFKHMNALYIATSIVFLWIIFAIVGAIADYTSKKAHLRAATNVSPPCTARNQTNKPLEDESRVFEDANGLKKAEISGDHIVSASSDIVVESEKSFGRFYIDNYFLTNYVCFPRENNARPCIAATFFACILVQLIICGVCSPHMHFALAAAVAQGVALFAAPLLLFAFFVPRFISGCWRVVKIIFAVLIGLLLIVGITGGIGKMSDESSENRMFEWMAAFGVAMLYEIVFGQTIRIALKFAIVRMSTPASFIGRFTRSS